MADKLSRLERSIVLRRKIEKNQSGSDLSTDDIPIFELTLAPALEQEQPSLPQLVWAEVNILALPFAVLDEREARSSSGHEIIKFDKSNGKQIVWLWRVWPDPKVGMPTMATLRVLFALMDIGEETRKIQGTHPKKVEFSLSDLCRRVGFKADGRHRAMIKRHIEILLSTQCKSKGAFKDKNKNGLILDTFRYIRQAAFAGEYDELGNTIEKNFVVFDDPVRLNLETKYIKQIDVAFMRRIGSSIGQLLYTKLSHLLHEAEKRGYDYVDVEYHWLAERMGIKVYGLIWEAKKQLKQAISELVREHYIKEPQWDGWNIRFYANVRHEFGERLPRQERKRAARKASGKRARAIAQPPPAVTEKTPIDPLWPVCSLYSSGGWALAEPHARRHRMTEDTLRTETISRDLPVPAPS